MTQIGTLAEKVEALFTLWQKTQRVTQMFHLDLAFLCAYRLSL